MNRNGIINGVKVKMDEMTPDGVSVPFEESIGPVMDECAREILRTAPLPLLPHAELSLAGLEYDDQRSYIPLPLDFVRIGKIRYPKWEKAVTRLIMGDSPEYALQDNKYTRGGFSRPIVALIDKEGDKVLECSKVDSDVDLQDPLEATYIKDTLPEDFPDVLMDTLEWLTASTLLQIIGDDNGFKMAQARYEQSLKQL